MIRIGKKKQKKTKKTKKNAFFLPKKNEAKKTRFFSSL